MSEPWFIVLVCYLIGFAVQLLVAYAVWIDGRYKNDRNAARLLLTSWAWPVVLMVGVGAALRALWDAAEWKSLR